MIDLSGKTALITGASRGIGRAIALRLAQAGADIAVNFVTRQSAATQVANEICALGRRAVTVKADVSEPEDVESMMGFLESEFGSLEILVSNAASGGFRNLMDATPRHFEATMNTNVRALMLLCQKAAPLMRSQLHPSKVVALSSHGSHRALPAYGLIGASKAALESLARHLALEIGPQGINVNVLLAGLVETDSTRSFPGSEEAFATVASKRPSVCKELQPQAIADAVLFLTSPLSDHIQGTTLVVDSGEALHV